MRLFGPWFAAASVIAACTSFTGTDDSSPQVNDAGTKADVIVADADVATSEASVDTDAGATAPVEAGAPVNLLLNGDFEQDCTHWTSMNVTTVGSSSEHHSGGHSCSVCAVTGTATFTSAVSFQLVEGMVFAGSAWVRSAPGIATGAVQVQVDVDKALTAIAEGPASQTLPLTPTWTQVKANVTVNDISGDGVDLTFDINAPACVLIDDAMLYLESQ